MNYLGKLAGGINNAVTNTLTGGANQNTNNQQNQQNA